MLACSGHVANDKPSMYFPWFSENTRNLRNTAPFVSQVHKRVIRTCKREQTVFSQKRHRMISLYSLTRRYVPCWGINISNLQCGQNCRYLNPEVGAADRQSRSFYKHERSPRCVQKSKIYPKNDPPLTEAVPVPLRINALCCGHCRDS